MKINNQKSVAEAYAAMDAKANSNDAAKMINEQWGPMLERTTGVKDPEKLAWMSQLAHFTAKSLNEDAQQIMGNGVQNPNSAFGGVYSPYNTLYNTLGVGNVVPAGKPALTGADYATDKFNGSGDKFPALLPLAMKVAANTIGFDLVNTTPLAGPSGVLPYMDYVYTGSKQPYGATPAYSPATANPKYINQYAAKSGSSSEERFKPYALYALPSSFKAALIAEDHSNASGSINVIMTKYDLKSAGLQAGCKMITEGEDPLTVEFVGWSRIDGDPMFKTICGTKSLGEYFEAGEVKFTEVTEEADPITMRVEGPKMISMLEDSILGYAGAGEFDQAPWAGTYQDGKHLYDPMSRATGEMTPAREISMQLFTKNITVGTIQIACAVTQEQVTDLNKQWGIDVVKMIENAAINELSQTINRHITSRLFGLGWKNHAKLIEVEGMEACMNISFIKPKDDKIVMTEAYAIPQGEYDEQNQRYTSEEQVALPMIPFGIIEGANFENRDTLIKRIFTNILAASNWIQQRGRYGAATFVVTNIRVATLLQSDAHYTFSPIENTLSQAAGQLYPIGKVCGLTVYVDPLMGAGDTRVLVGRKGAKDEPGTHLCPYVMAEVYRTIAEATMAPKLLVKSRYALADVGFFPECQYVTFFVDCRGL